ncbi:MAG: AhpC/TSA family protein [Bacteroidales bacterium]|nr:AhpC/TSA family protein [Bacteroidales bacterium]
MKKLIVASLILTIIVSCTNNNETKNNFTINGVVENQTNGTVFLKKRVGGDWIILDSTEQNNGNYKFSGLIGLPEQYYIQIDEKNLIPVFVEASEIIINSKTDSIGKITDTKITGSTSQDNYGIFKKKTKSFDRKSNDLYKQWKEANKAEDKELMAKIDTAYDDNDKELKKFIIDYVIENNNSAVTAYITLRNSYKLDLSELDSITSNFTKEISESKYVILLKDKVEILKNCAVGKQFIEITLNDTSGNPVSLSSLKGKYILLDFWASWCSPCRAENPNVLAVYNDFKDKGFDVFSVSLDDKKEKWIEGINKDGLVWTNVSDLKGWKCAARDDYGFNSIPHSILIDKNGIIIAKNLRGEYLRKKIEEVID